VEDNRLAALWLLIALRGLRRGEAAALDREALDEAGTRRLVDQELDLPPIRLHDLRHGAATIALASRTDLKVIQQMLGHSSIVTTADTYTSVLPEAAHRAAQAIADMIIEAARSIPRGRPGSARATHIPAAVTASGYCQI
jgi:integrase